MRMQRTCSAPAPAGGSCALGVITRSRHLRQLVVHQSEVTGHDVIVVLQIGSLLVSKVQDQDLGLGLDLGLELGLGLGLGLGFGLGLGLGLALGLGLG